MSDIKITNSPAKIELLKEWVYRKGHQPWTAEEISELIADATWLAEQRIIKLLEKCKCDCGYDCGHYEVDPETIALIKGENK